MIQFKEVIGTQEEKPLAIDTKGSPGKVYVRKNIIRSTFKSGEEEIPCWKYDECLMTLEEFATYTQASTEETLSAIDETLSIILLNQLEV